MPRTYDIENLLDDIEALLASKLNTKIAAIDAEKVTDGGMAILSAVDSGAYFRQTWDDKILNYSPALFFGLEDIQTNGSNSASLDVYKIFVEIIFVDNGLEVDKKWLSKMLRYSRALKEVFQENFSALPWNTKTNIETVRPLSFKLNADSSEEIRVGGISITTALA